MRMRLSAVLPLLAPALLLQPLGGAKARQAAPSGVEVPVVKGESGSCGVDFKVTDAEGAPVFNARVRVNLAQGFMSKRKLELEVGTNQEGKARIEGLPEKLKKPPVQFEVRQGEKKTTVAWDPATECQGSRNVVLK